jgi:hypothetical protein
MAQSVYGSGKVDEIRKEIEELRSIYPDLQRSLDEAASPEAAIDIANVFLHNADDITQRIAYISNLHRQLFNQLKDIDTLLIPQSCGDRDRLAAPEKPACDPVYEDARGCCGQSSRYDPSRSKYEFLSCYYYACAAKSFSDLGCGKGGKPNYLIDYGLRNCSYFTSVTYDFLSPKGREWLTKTLACLQDTLSNYTLHNSPPPSCEKISQEAFDSHVPCYVRSGLCKLSLADQIVIGTTPDVDALLSNDALKQAKGAVDYCIDTWTQDHRLVGGSLKAALWVALGNRWGTGTIQYTGELAQLLNRELLE